MATRRSRIKAIVNVPARRAKASEESENSKINSSSICDADKVKISPSDKKDLNPAPSLNVKGDSDEVHSSVKEHSPSSQEKAEHVSCTKNASEDLTNGKDSESRNIDTTHDGELQNVNDVVNENSESIEKTLEKHDEQTNLEKSSPDETCAYVSSDKVVANSNASKGGPLNSPLKQRPRLFIRPSPKLVDASGRRRYPSGSRHKTLSESEEETRTKAVVDDATVSFSETASRAPNSSHSKTAKSQETVATNSQETAVGDAKKNSSRPGRQRAKNKENRACDSRRRIWQKMKKGNESVPLDRSRLTMFDYIYYNPVSNPMRSSSESSVISKEKDSEKRIESEALSEELVDDPGEGGSLLSQQKEKDDDENEDAGVPAPRVKVGPNGELILDEQSLVIETTGLKEGLKDLANGPALIESSSFTNYATYRKRSKGHDWSDAETLRFYRALNVVGTDFSLMQSLLFNKRSRRDLKNKFKREERRNPSLIEKALRYPGVFSNAEELQSEFARIEPPEKEKTEGKKGKGQKREKKCAAPRSGQPPAKKKKRGKHWLVDGNVSQGEDSEDNGNANELEKEVEADAGKSVDGGTPEVVFSVSSEEVMMASQEIVLTNEDSLPPSCGGKSEEESDASESSESGFLSRVLQPTRSGRIPKRREVKVLPNQRKAQAKEKCDGSLKKEAEMEEIVQPTDHLERDPLEPDSPPLDDPRPTVSIEVRDCAPSNMDVSEVEPGSLVVIATTAPDDPSRKVYEVFMVAPQIQDSLLVSQNVSIEENIGMIKGDSKMFPSIHGGEGVICQTEGFESCSMDTNVGLQT